MIQLLSRFGERTRRKLRGADRLDAGCKPALTPTCAVMDTGPSDVQNLESINMSNKGNKSLRVANPQGLRHIVLFICLLGCFITNKAADLILNENQSIPMNNGEYSSIQEVRLVFDLSNIEYGSVSPETCGVISSMSSSRNITLYKGDATNGELMATIKKTISNTSPEFKVGNSIELMFDQEYILEPGQEYTLKISKNAIKYSSPQTTGSIATIPETLITFNGAEASAETLMMVSASPTIASEIPTLGLMTITFNQEVELSKNAVANLYEDDVLLKSANIEMSENDGSSIVADFGNEVLYINHHYNVKIDENTIFSKSINQSYKATSISYDGASYKYYSYGRIAPSNNSEVSYLSNVTIPLRFEEGCDLGRSKAPKAYLYEGDVTEPISTFDCDTGVDAKSWIIPVWNFDLKPSTEYRIVIPAEQVSPWETTDTGGLREVKDTTNPELVLNYTTPAVIDPLPRQGFKSTVPDGTEPIENLTSLRVDFAPYEFEDVFYYPVFPSTLTEGYNLVKFVDVTTGDESSFPVEIKWDDANNYWLENSGEINYTLLKGHDYQVVIPAGMFRCRLAELGDNSANEEYAINFKGATRTEFDVTFILAEVGSMKSVVAAGKTLSVDLAGTEDWKVSAVLFNGEAVETAGDTYTTPAIEDDATIEVEYEYAHEIDYDFTSGVGEIADCPFSISHEGDMLVISGVKEGDSISIYAVNGMKMAVLPPVSAGNDVVSISLPTGQVYIILINGKSVKVAH